MRGSAAQAAVFTALACAMGQSACTDDPIYVQSAVSIEVGADGMPGAGTAQLMLPIRLELSDEASERADRAAELGVEVPYITRDDFDLSLEWTVKNLSDANAVARIQVNGANEWFAYVPGAFVVDPDEEEAPPPLLGDVPLEFGPGEVRSGVFREDELAEAALDLELITRGALNPFSAVLDVHEDIGSLDVGGVAVPIADTAHLVRFDLILVADRHMVLEFAVRARDHRRPNLLHDELADAPPDELTTFAPADFAPAAP